MTRDAKRIWIDAKAHRLGYADGEAFAAVFSLKPYRIGQLYHAAMRELAADPSTVSTLAQSTRDALVEAGMSFDSVTPVVIERSSDRQTSKGLFRLHDGKEVEAVLMEHNHDRNTVCISSQAGCAFACAFCSTGQAGFSRNLTADEIVDQARFFARELIAKGEKITNIVFMGMGEPFHNYDAVMEAVALLNDPKGFGLGHRHITISTVGLVDKIDRFTDEGIQVNLAISLHAPTDEVRNRFMPVNKKFSTRVLLAACERYVEKTRRKVFFEYVMLADVNDSDECAHALARQMRGHLYHVNLIPYNSTPDAAFTGTPDARIWAFAKILEEANVPTTVRYNMGRDISAACGQLRAQTQPKAVHREPGLESQPR